MPDQAPFPPKVDAWVARPSRPAIGIALDAAWRLGARPVVLWLGARALRGAARRRLRDLPAPEGRFLPTSVPSAPALAQGSAEAVLDDAAALPRVFDWHGAFDREPPALSVVLHARGGVRPVWEASRLGALPLLAMAARLDPAGGHLARAEGLLGDWCRANPPFRGANWACGQEAALRAIHLALTLALLDADRDPPPASRALLALCARRIAATPLYALAQDNNHPVSEAAGGFACALLLDGDTRRHAAALSRRVARLVAPDGGFAQVSPGYARLLLDTLSAVEWLRRRQGAPPFPAPLAERAAALAAWLHRITDPATGGTPPLGVEDGSCFADLSRRGPADARGSIERAARVFAEAGGDAPDDAGCAWLGLPAPSVRLDRPARWRSAGTRGWHANGATAVLRTGPLRFRPAQADLLHLSLRDGATWVIRDGGTGSYDPPAAWWWSALAGAAAHDAPVFDGVEPMPRAGRFLLARWPVLRDLPDGAAARDAHANETRREVHVEDRIWTVHDRLRGPFRRAVWHWRLCPAGWCVRGTSAESAAAVINVDADAPLRLALVEGWESPAYGAVVSVAVLRVEAAAPVSRMTTRIRLP